MINFDQTQARELAASFREALVEYRDMPYAELTDAAAKDTIRFWVQKYARDIVEFDPDWHYFTLGEMNSLTATLGKERGLFNGCTGVWLAEIYGPTVERDNVVNTWRMPHADWIRFEANRLDYAWLTSSS